MKAKPTILATFFVSFLFGSVFAQDGDLPGDANCDGTVNVLDVTTIVNYYVGNAPESFCFENADVNGDGVINVIDVVLTVNIFFEDPGFACGNNITFTYRGDQVTYGTILRNGLCWLDRNLGADPMPFVPAVDATGNTDTRLYGDLFQWGRLDDGHQDRTSTTIPGPVNQTVPGHGNFITAGSSPWDWHSPQNDALWQGEDGTNSPCPPGWRVPTEAELNAERLSWDANNLSGAYASALKWPAGGFRSSLGSLSGVGFHGPVWSSSVGGVNASYLSFGSDSADMYSGFRAFGMSVRCVRD
ncbi:MAG: FISUMP domain-containing protein [Bacteroidales bacterium]|nr:FISUMP domain-containing protein [Bacteroidales bacterium]